MSTKTTSLLQGIERDTKRAVVRMRTNYLDILRPGSLALYDDGSLDGCCLSFRYPINTTGWI